MVVPIGVVSYSTSNSSRAATASATSSLIEPSVTGATDRNAIAVTCAGGVPTAKEFPTRFYVVGQDT